MPTYTSAAALAPPSVCTRAGSALALVEGRDYVTPDDVKRLVKPVLAHRLLPRARPVLGRRRSLRGSLEDILGRTPPPI